VTEVVVHRCVIRVRRTSGWAWGASPDALLAAATRALPQLIATRLGAIAERHDEPVQVVQPIKIEIAATVAELAGLADPASTRALSMADRIAAQVNDAVLRAMEEHAEPTIAAHAHEDGKEHDTSNQPVPVPIDTASDAARRATRVWFRAGELSTVLDRIDPAALQRLHDLLLKTPGESSAAHPELAAIAESVVLRFARDGRLDARVVRITIAAAMLDALPATPPAELCAAIDRVWPITPSVQGVAATSANVPGAAPPAREWEPAQAASPALEQPLRPLHTSELEIRSALPFLLLPSLRHAGWLDSAATLLAANGVEDAAFALGAGLAAKVLDPLERGWLRAAADRAVIAAFLGLEDTIEDGAIAAAAHRLAPMLPALDATLRAVLARARRARPLVLWREANAWLLLDTDGMVALSVGSELASVIDAAYDALILVPAACATPGVLERLDLANRRFVTDAPASRGEPWRAFMGSARRLYTNDTATPVPRLVAHTIELDATFALAAELAEILAARPSLARDPLVRLDATCALAATAALADLGARLFPTEATTPVLVLTRFRDLDARVRFEPERIRVRVPIGRRHGDLLRHGVLGTPGYVPWLGGRVVDLGGG
jgi:hypothetical protein